jgi:phosphatidylinositol 4-kinase
MSNTYSLLNLMAASSLEPPMNPAAQGLQHQLPDESGLTHPFASSLLENQNEGHRGLLAISTIAVVTCLALEFNVEEASESPRTGFHIFMKTFCQVTRLTISMLIQRLRTAEPMVEAAITYHLVNLVLIAPKSAVGDIIRAFSALHRATNRIDPSFSHNTVKISSTKSTYHLSA